MVSWKWAVGPPAPSGVPERQLTAASARSITWRVDGAMTAQFQIDGRHAEAAVIVERETDLWVWRDGALMFRGRIVAGGDDLGASGHRCQFTAIDYRGMLAYRLIGVAGRTFATVDQGAIAWTLIDESQALTAGDWGITDGAGATSGTTRDRTYDPGKPVLEAIEQLARVDGGFEWEISPELELNRWYPHRGTAAGRVLDYGGVLTSVRRLSSPGDWANSVISVGGQGTTPADETSATIAADPSGRWEMYDGDGSSIIEQATLDARAVWVLEQAATSRPEIAVTWAAGRWGGLTDVGPGDTVTLAVKSGRMQISALHRVVELAVSLDTAGVETVAGGLVAA